MGIYEIPDEQYRKMDGLSQSQVKKLLKSGLEYLAPATSSSDAFRVGSLIDVMTLQPELVGDQFCIPPDYANSPNNVTADGKPSTSNRTGFVKERMREFARANQGKTFVSKDEWDLAQILSYCCRNKPFFKDFLADESHKTQLALDGTIAGLHCKGLVDGITSNMLFDLKSTKDSNINSFRNAFFRYQYGFQLRWYLELAWDNGYDIPIDNCYIIAAGKNIPHDVTVFRIPAEWMDAAKRDIEFALDRYKRYGATGEFAIGQDEGRHFMMLNEDPRDPVWD